ncbi:hypothetical protein [Streptomyces sp. NPDC002746]
MTSEDRRGRIQERVIIEYPDGTRLSKSHVPGDAPDGRSSLLRDYDNRLAGHGVILDPEEELLTRSEADQLADERVRQAQEDADVRLRLFTAGSALATLATYALVTKAAPRVKTGYTRLKAKLNRQPEPAVEAPAATIEVEFIGRAPAQLARNLGIPET